MTQNILLQKRLETLSKIPMYFVLVISFSLLVSKFVLPSLFEILCWHTTPMLPVGALAYLLTGIAYLLITADNGKKVKKNTGKNYCYFTGQSGNGGIDNAINRSYYFISDTDSEQEQCADRKNTYPSCIGLFYCIWFSYMAYRL